TISAIGVGGGQAVYTGSLDGLIYLAADGQTVHAPHWGRCDDDRALPERPVSWIAVDRSNYRIAYASYTGFDEATPDEPGQIFRTLDGGKKWTHISGHTPNPPDN